MDQYNNIDRYSPLYIVLMTSNILVYNYMLDYGPSNNVVSLNVTNQLGLEVIRTYKNVCAMDSRQNNVYGMIKGFC